MTRKRKHPASPGDIRLSAEAQKAVDRFDRRLQLLLGWRLIFALLVSSVVAAVVATAISNSAANYTFAGLLILTFIVVARLGFVTDRHSESTPHFAPPPLHVARESPRANGATRTGRFHSSCGPRPPQHVENYTRVIPRCCVGDSRPTQDGPQAKRPDWPEVAGHTACCPRHSGVSQLRRPDQPGQAVLDPVPELVGSHPTTVPPRSDKPR